MIDLIPGKLQYIAKEILKAEYIKYSVVFDALRTPWHEDSNTRQWRLILKQIDTLKHRCITKVYICLLVKQLKEVGVQDKIILQLVDEYFDRYRIFIRRLYEDNDSNREQSK